MNHSSALHSLLDSSLIQEERQLRNALHAARPDPYLEGTARDSLLLLYLRPWAFGQVGS